ncbi:MAG: SDR family oxidoreductase [Pseudonocardiaceae bacterium]|nr:MAG: SDR family oxidoreductase [Pseudonocardiaceae bacterium]
MRDDDGPAEKADMDELSTPQSFRLDGSTALITGASRNIGRAIATAFAQAGADLILVARDAARLARVAEAIGNGTGVFVDYVAADIAEPWGVDAVLDAVADVPVDILVNNAHTVGGAARIVSATDAVWESVLATNLWAPLRLARRLVPRMEAAGAGCVINLVSGSGLLPTPELGPYGVSKAALWMLTRYLAVEAAPTVRVNALCPGLVSEDGEPRNESHRAIIASVPMGRVGRPEEIAGAAVYLASQAASYTTGEMLVVNGGRSW